MEGISKPKLDYYFQLGLLRVLRTVRKLEYPQIIPFIKIGDVDEFGLHLLTYPKI